MPVAAGSVALVHRLTRLTPPFDLTGPTMGPMAEEKYDKNRPLPEPWEDDAEFPMDNWREVIANGDELRGYRSWVAHMRGIEKTPYWQTG